MGEARKLLALYFEPDRDELAKAQVLNSFVEALIDLPAWALHEAFQRWLKTGTRRPSPAEIRMKAESAMKPYADMLALRVRTERSEPDNFIVHCPTENEKLRVGKMVKTFEIEAKAKDRKSRPEYERSHWAERLAPGDWRLEQLERVRRENPLMRNRRKSLGENA